MDDLLAAWRTKMLRKEMPDAPQLAQPGWYALVGEDQRTADDKAEAEMSPEARRIMERKRRKQTAKANAANAEKRSVTKAAMLREILLPKAA